MKNDRNSLDDETKKLMLSIKPAAPEKKKQNVFLTAPENETDRTLKVDQMTSPIKKGATEEKMYSQSQVDLIKQQHEAELEDVSLKNVELTLEINDLKETIKQVESDKDSKQQVEKWESYD